MSSNGRAILNRQIERLRSLSSFVQEAAPEVATELRRELVEQIDRGETPEGQPWPLTKDGDKALRNAASNLNVAHQGTVVIATLTGHHARHDLGAVRGKVRRQIMPTARMPQKVADAIGKVFERRFKEHMGVVS